MGLDGLVACFIAINTGEFHYVWNLKLIGWKSMIIAKSYDLK